MRSHYFFIFIFLFVLVLIGQSTEALYGISAKSDDSSYEPGDTITIKVMVLNESMITVQVKNPYGSIMIIKTTSSVDGTGRIRFKLDTNAVKGKYRFYAAAVSLDGEYHAMTSGGFKVKDGANLAIPVPEIVGSIVTVGVFGALWVSERGRYFLLARFFVPLYSRFKPNIEKDLVQQNNRGRIYQHIKEMPGTSLTKIMNAVETGNGTTVYHLKVLEREGMIIRKGKQYFIKGARPPLFGEMKRPLKEREATIVKYLKDNQTTNERMLSEELKARQSVVNRDLKTLMNFQILTRYKTSGVYYYSLTPRYKKWCWEQNKKAMRLGKNYCPYCGKEILMPGAIYCNSCGRKIG